MRILAELADAKDFWLEDSDRLGLDVYKKSVSEKVRYYYTGGKAFKGDQRADPDKIYCRHMKKKDLA